MGAWTSRSSTYWKTTVVSVAVLAMAGAAAAQIAEDRGALIMRWDSCLIADRNGDIVEVPANERCLLRVVRSYVAYFGSVKEKVAPCPSPLSTQMAPPICSTAILQKGRPSPVSALAGVPRSKCWKRSKIL
jgi:hypothetical protein